MINGPLELITPAVRFIHSCDGLTTSKLVTAIEFFHDIPEQGGTDGIGLHLFGLDTGSERLRRFYFSQQQQVEQQPVAGVSGKRIALLDEMVEDSIWYHIYYFDNSGAEHIGTISGSYFELFNIEMLVEEASDPDSMNMIDALLALPEISATVEGSSTHNVDMSGIGFTRN